MAREHLADQVDSVHLRPRMIKIESLFASNDREALRERPDFCVSDSSGVATHGKLPYWRIFELPICQIHGARLALLVAAIPG